jgi:hypothetical protein
MRRRSFRVDEYDRLGIACPVASIGATRLQPTTKQYMLNETKIFIKYEILR